MSAWEESPQQGTKLFNACYMMQQFMDLHQNQQKLENRGSGLYARGIEKGCFKPRPSPPLEAS